MKKWINTYRYLFLLLISSVIVVSGIVGYAVVNQSLPKVFAGEPQTLLGVPDFSDNYYNSIKPFHDFYYGGDHEDIGILSCKSRTESPGDSVLPFSIDSEVAKLPEGQSEAGDAGNVVSASEQETQGDDTLVTAGEDDEVDSSPEASEEPEEIKEPMIGTEENPAITEFITYEPAEVKSRYYTDPGKIPLTTDYPYETVEDSYFEDAAWIGDSRAVGIFDYSGWTSDFYCDNGYCTYHWTLEKPVLFQNEHRKVNLDEALSEKQYSKIYLMIGMNDCGFGTTADFKERYEAMIAMIREKQPDAVLYLVANLYITEEKERTNDLFKLLHLRDKNVAIAECADGVHSFYLDYNDLFLDENGFLKSELSFDGVHLYAKSYPEWIEFFKTHAVVR